MSKKDKLEQFDAIKSERDKLQLAVYDLRGPTKFPFGKPVTVDLSEIDSTYKRGEQKIKVSVSPRTCPLYMVEHESGVEFWFDYEIEQMGRRGYGAMLRHAAWMLTREGGR